MIKKILISVMGSVFSDVLEIDSITIVQPTITYETKITTDNIRALLANLPESGAASSGSAESGEDSQQLVIHELRILDSQLNLVAAVVTAPIVLTDIEIRDIGGEGGSTSAVNAVRVVLAELSRSILNSDLPSLDLLRESVEERIEDGAQKVEEAVEDLGGRLRGLLN